ncbi:MAG: CpsD/CapB family tyrosine-protein kinase [Planctomycetes bacterium]|nr:CpsD/CapB family tyrosine-protein kinase [Planctomycetota bacterium]MBI3847004.1 CpsD/CapB family tyrosine-protein kinase [Planctomycetota bacterium]
MWHRLRGGRDRSAAEPPPDLVVVVDQTVDPRIVLYHEPRGIHAEQYRTSRTNLLATNREGAKKAYVFTSARAEEGKSVSAANMALCLAEQAPLKVCLVDADLRKPSLAAMWSLRQSPGLCEVLLEGLPLESVILDTRSPSLHILPAGTPPGNPADAVSHPAMREIILKLKEKYDYIVFDTPPALLYSDAAVLGAMSDGIIFVTRINHTPRQLVDESMEALQRAGGKVLFNLLTGATPAPKDEKKFYAGA